MQKQTASTERLQRVSKICLTLPAVTRQDKGDHVAFLVGKKIFAYSLNDHHGDGILGLWCKVLPGENVLLIEASPRKFYMPAYVGPRSWVGLRLDRPTVDWNEVKELLHGSYALTASRKFLEQAQLD